ncbi:signal peptidase I [Streptococcus rubneri]|jgi:signal peptidase I|uniref:Signal peptidase I n=1 Tax=Streptococcus rubneri TaxID=1234680 RepID=A0A4Z1DV82_9STRE|nr:signal peptidase I [Streptococcus rubneri]MBK4773862.1 signal peptidase I [Streptococcus rubneri]TGN92592.1 signal peptidase I [Streptococcus rubneri]
MKRSQTTTSSNPILAFLKEWGLFILIITSIILSRIFLWTPVRVDGHSMDPTLADNEYLLVINKLPINRFDIVVASETENGKTKEIVKRVIGLPGDTIQYENDTLYINGKKTDEPYLKEYIKKFKEDKLQSTYTGKGFEENGELFRQMAQSAQAFTVDQDGSATFTKKLLDDEYLLLGDDRIVSKDSRQVGAFKKSQIKGEAVFRLWPLLPFKTY